MHARRERAHNLISLALLLALVSIQCAVAIHQANAAGPLVGDELYYVARAETIARDGALPKADAAHFEIQAGRLFGKWNDYRPTGYPLILAAIGVPFQRPAVQRTLATVLNLGFVATSLVSIFLSTEKSLRARYAVAALLGLQPWLFEWSASIYPDSLNASLFFCGSLALNRSSAGAYSKWVWGLLGGLLLGICVQLRPEMFLFVPIPPLVILAKSCHAHGLRKAFATSVPAWTIIALSVALLFGHRYWFEGRMVPKFVKATPGLETWATTWFARESEQCDLTWDLRKGRSSFEQIPGRAFASDAERNRVRRILVEASGRGGFDRAADDEFLALAVQRRRAWFSHLVAPRLWFAAHLWINSNTSSHLLKILAEVPVTLRHALLGGIFVLKGCVLAAPALLFWRRRELNIGPDDVDTLFWIAGVFLVARTLFIGLVRGSCEHRLVAGGWPFLLLCSAALVSALLDPSSRIGRDSEEIRAPARSGTLGQIAS